MIGTTVGKYRIVGRLGRGGMGTVYKALDETLDREVAIKVLNSDASDVKLMARFRAEATTLARLNHPQIATIYEIYQNEGDLLMVMELVRGETLDALSVRSGALAAEQAGALIVQILGGLSHAHRAGIVHRDLKPANIMLTDSGTIKIMDFGIARVLGAEHLTSDGTMIGTPAYMAPEQILGKDIDARADLYSTGVVFYRLISGCLPFQADTPIAMVQKQLWDPPAPVRTHREDLPPWCDPILTRALAKTPAERFQTADEFRSALLSAIGNSGERFAADSGTFTFTGLIPPAAVAAPDGLGRDTASGVASPPATSPSQPSLSSGTTTGALTLIRGKDLADPRTPVESGTGAGSIGSGPATAAPMPLETASATGRLEQPGAALPIVPEVPSTPAVPGSKPVVRPSIPSRSRPQPIAAIAAAATLVLVALAAGATLLTRRAPAPQNTIVATPPSETPPESSPPPADQTASPAAPETPTASTPPVAPATVPVTANKESADVSKPPSAGAPPASSAPPATAARRTAADSEPSVAAPSPVAPSAASPPSPREPAAASAAALLPPVTFSAQTVVVEGGKNRQRDTNVQLANGIVTVTGKDNKVMITVPYESVVGVSYSNSKQPMWNTPQGPAEVVHLDGGAFGFLKGDQHWVSVRTDSMSLVLRVRDSDSRRVINAIEERIGKKVETVDDRKNR
jgi:serine/threonine-protein kinase